MRFLKIILEGYARARAVRGQEDAALARREPGDRSP